MALEPLAMFAFRWCGNRDCPVRSESLKRRTFAQVTDGDPRSVLVRMAEEWGPTAFSSELPV